MHPGDFDALAQRLQHPPCPHRSLSFSISLSLVSPRCPHFRSQISYPVLASSTVDVVSLSTLRSGSLHRPPVAPRQVIEIAKVSKVKYELDMKIGLIMTIFLPVIGLVDPDELKPGDLVGVNKDS